jgi:hypothetical protein
MNDTDTLAAAARILTEVTGEIWRHVEEPCISYFRHRGSEVSDLEVCAAIRAVLLAEAPFRYTGLTITHNADGSCELMRWDGDEGGPSFDTFAEGPTELDAYVAALLAARVQLEREKQA